MTENQQTTVQEQQQPADVRHLADFGSFTRRVSGAILLGAAIVSLTMLYNTKVLSTRLDKLTNGQVAGAVLNNGGLAGAQALGDQLPQPVPDEGPVEIAVRADAPSLGGKTAKVVMYEFTDFQCPFCQRFYSDSYKQIKTKYIDTGKIQFISRHYPLAFHQNAQKAAEAAECANRQGKYFPYHDYLFEKMQPDGTGLAVADLKQYAKDLKLNTSKFNQCLDNSETKAVVDADMKVAQSAGVTGTPTLFINGKKIVGAQPFSVFEQAIEEALKAE